MPWTNKNDISNALVPFEHENCFSSIDSINFSNQLKIMFKKNNDGDPQFKKMKTRCDDFLEHIRDISASAHYFAENNSVFNRIDN